MFKFLRGIFGHKRATATSEPTLNYPDRVLKPSVKSRTGQFQRTAHQEKYCAKVDIGFAAFKAELKEEHPHWFVRHDAYYNSLNDASKSLIRVRDTWAYCGDWNQLTAAIKDKGHDATYVWNVQEEVDIIVQHIETLRAYEAANKVDLCFFAPTPPVYYSCELTNSSKTASEKVRRYHSILTARINSVPDCELERYLRPK